MSLPRLGALLRERRGGRGIREVAQEIGISGATLTRVEAGRVPDLETFRKICAWANINPAEILDVPIETRESAATNEPPTVVAGVHLRAEKTLPPEAANDLAQLIVVAHHELARRARGRRTDVPTWL